MAVQQLDPDLSLQLENAKEQGKAVLVINDSVDSKLIEIEGEANKDFDPQKAIFSAKVTAVKPG